MIDEGMVEGDGGPFNNAVARSSPGRTLPEMYDDILDAIYQHLSVLDRVHLQNIFPGRLHAHSASHWMTHTRRSAFTLSRRSIRLYGRGGADNDPMTEDRMMYVMQTLMPVVGPVITDLTVNYHSLDEWPRAAQLLSVLVHTFCRSLVRLHVMNASYQHKRQPMLVPDMSYVESLVFTDQQIGINHDEMMALYLAECASSLESLSIHRTTMSGECLRPLHNLKYLRIRSNLTLRQHMFPDGQEFIQLRALYMADLDKFFRESSVRHLEMQQEKLTYFDAMAVLRMPVLSHLTLTVDNGSTETLNEFMREILLPDTIEHLTLTGSEKEEYLVEHATLEAISRTRRLRFLQLNGVAVRSHLLEAMQELKTVNSAFQYVLK